MDGRKPVRCYHSSYSVCTDISQNGMDQRIFISQTHSILPDFYHNQILCTEQSTFQLNQSKASQCFETLNVLNYTLNSVKR